MSDDMVTVEGTITSSHKGSLFTVQYLVGGETLELLARPAGKMKKYGIRLTVGDKVEVEISPYDLSKGRIKYRIK